ncbi:growth-regulating factor 3-like [Nicotiana tabacum]|uniref:Growth-regulating factor n=2 Tax=Nicotiana TaxID=4085 RepID=A0A1S3Y0B5_TOBAC|nr:PREDICTED: growth-regulating factor 3-like [Nicotiana sylvestris]XP_016445515.1 PREDICTED: growth-regulating factor 3-like [Nicotiana tabacum]
MDFNMKQWKNQQQQQQNESEEEIQTQIPSAKLPRLVLDLDSSFSHSASDSALPLFISEPTKLSAYSLSSDSTFTPTKFTRMGSSYFSLAQWQELELQALIYRHMLAGAPVPLELLHLVKKSLINSSPYNYLPQSFQQYHHYQQALVQSGYWGRTGMDPEPGRCRRTDGKKWRCSRDVVSGHKYCERHVHRGRNRSRKPVEIPTTAAPSGGVNTANNDGGEVLKVNSGHASGAPHFTLSGTSPSIDVLHLNQRPSECIKEQKGPLEAQNDVTGDGKSSGQILRCFFDDWPRQLQEGNNARSNGSSVSSATNLSISMPGNPSSDFSLKLSTGDRHNSGVGVSNVERSPWGTNQVTSMGGPLAEALRSSTSNSSPTSVLHRLPRGSASEASYVST